MLDVYIYVCGIDVSRTKVLVFTLRISVCYDVSSLILPLTFVSVMHVGLALSSLWS